MLKSKIVLSAVALSTFASFAMADDVVVQEEKDYGIYAYGSVDAASACISGSGYASTDGFNLQPCFGFGGNAWGVVPLEFCMWGLYTLENDSFDSMYKDAGWNEVDLSIIHAMGFDNGFGYSIALTSWIYPNVVEGAESEDVLEMKITQKLCDYVKLGYEVEWMITGGAKDDIRMMPEISVGGNITDDVSASVTGKLFYKIDHDGDDGFSNWNVKLAVSAYGFTAYTHWFQEIDEDIYGEQAEDFVYGLSYGFDF